MEVNAATSTQAEIRAERPHIKVDSSGYGEEEMAPGMDGFAVLCGLAACRIELIQRLA